MAREACGHLSENRRRAGTVIHPELRAGELRLRRLGVEGDKVEKRLKDSPQGRQPGRAGWGRRSEGAQEANQGRLREKSESWRRGQTRWRWRQG